MDNEKIALKEDEVVKVEIIQTKDGAVSIGVKANGEIDLTQLIGLIEVAKLDLIVKQDVSVNQENNAVTEIVLTEQDFELDVTGQLKDRKIGDILPVPVQVAEMREAAIAQLNKSKEDATE